MPGVSVDDFKRAMASFTAGVTVVTTLDDAGRAWGLTATAFSSVSKTPPLCLVCVSHAADAYPALLASRRFAVNVLSSDQEAVASRFAEHGVDKFAGVAWKQGPATGSPLIEGALTTIECVVDSAQTAGDHDVFIASVRGVVVADGAPLAYFRGRYADVRSK
jgi:flavin reductase (DIM6/NTAB) family NADH-FMN oxidoreductase RutF